MDTSKPIQQMKKRSDLEKGMKSDEMNNPHYSPYFNLESLSPRSGTGNSSKSPSSSMEPGSSTEPISYGTISFDMKSKSTKYSTPDNTSCSSKRQKIHEDSDNSGYQCPAVSRTINVIPKTTNLELEDCRKKLRELEKALRDYFAFRNIIESVPISRATLIKITEEHEEKEELVSECIEQKVFGDQILERDVEVIDVLINRIMIGKDVGIAKMTKDPTICNLSDEQIMESITNQGVEDRVVASVASWSPCMGQLFRNFVIPVTKREQVKVIKNSSIN